MTNTTTSTGTSTAIRAFIHLALPLARAPHRRAPICMPTPSATLSQVPAPVPTPGAAAVPARARALVSASVRVKRPLTLGRIAQRLSTIQDKGWQHKVPTILCVLSSVFVFALSVSGISIGAEIQLRPLIALWATATTGQSLSGVALAVRYRSNQCRVRFVFLTYALANFVNALMGAYAASLHPVCVTVVAAACIALLMVLQPLLICTRLPRKPREQLTMGSLLRWFIRSNCAAPIFAQIPILACVAAGITQGVIYATVANALCIGLAAFTLTVKDRKIIDDVTQHNLLVGSSLASFGLFISRI